MAVRTPHAACGVKRYGRAAQNFAMRRRRAQGASGNVAWLPAVNDCPRILAVRRANARPFKVKAVKNSGRNKTQAVQNSGRTKLRTFKTQDVQNSGRSKLRTFKIQE
jgi:hypothetical protein